MKKKVIICMTSMHLGGAERSLIGLLDAFDYERYDVSLFLYDHDGELMEQIPDKVRLLPEKIEYKALEQPIKYCINNKLWKIAIGRATGKFLAKEYSKRFKGCTDIIVGIEYKQKYTKRFLPAIDDDEYDLAISFMIPHYAAAEKIKAKTRLAWVHTDYTKMHLDIESEIKMWNKYDRIVGVSQGVADNFVSVFPTLKNKVIVVENILPKTLINKEAEAITPAFNKESVNLLSVGRFTGAKNFDNVPDICRRLLNKGVNVNWYLIGYGPDEDLIKKKITESDVEKNVVLLGKQSNPYPYIKGCDYYVQPSRYEGKAVTVREAQLLGKPVIITDYSTSKSQLTDGYDGMIVPLDNERCAESIEKILADKELKTILSKNCTREDYTNKNEIRKIYELIV